MKFTISFVLLLLALAVSAEELKPTEVASDQDAQEWHGRRYYGHHYYYPYGYNVYDYYRALTDTGAAVDRRKLTLLIRKRKKLATPVGDTIAGITVTVVMLITGLILITAGHRFPIRIDTITECSSSEQLYYRFCYPGIQQILWNDTLSLPIKKHQFFRNDMNCF
ncbi:uncharacterized protein LOC123470092 [Daphnia magna]|uniref:uncharacterized protein LOC123470092 n=1 Tax=Daphnia magna TaxID=35525 RepID=UPI001E1BAA7F|nr:uncharacterized protein LOC123470092 [Daphnia magna]